MVNEYFPSTWTVMWPKKLNKNWGLLRRGHPKNRDYWAASSGSLQFQHTHRGQGTQKDVLRNQ